jgi:hypothetical protein
LDGNAAAVDQARGRAIDQQWRLVAEIDRFLARPQTIWIAPSALIQAPCPLAHRGSVRFAQALIKPRLSIEPKLVVEPHPLSRQGSPQTKSPRRQDAAPFPARQRDEAAACLNRAVITGLSPLQTTLQECGASAAPRLYESPDQAKAGGAIHSARMR